MRRTTSHPSGSSRTGGVFDGGWSSGARTCFARQIETGVVPAGTALSARPSWIDEWSSLSPDAQRMLARQQEVFAGFLAHTDAQIGRVVAQLDALGELDNTLIMLVSDNGASGEGGALGTFNEHRFTEHLPDTVEGNSRGATSSAGCARTRTTRGAGRGPQHAVAAVEALHVARRNAHAARRALAASCRGWWRRCATSSCTRSI